MRAGSSRINDGRTGVMECIWNGKLLCILHIGWVIECILGEVFFNFILEVLCTFCTLHKYYYLLGDRYTPIDYYKET